LICLEPNKFDKPSRGEIRRDEPRALESVSVFISRKTAPLRAARLRADPRRSGHDPESRPADRHARRHRHGGVRDRPALERRLDQRRADAKSALDRIGISQDVLDRIAPTRSARSSIIISDEALLGEPASTSPEHALATMQAAVSVTPQTALRNR
jgi:hypothetical protein